MTSQEVEGSAESLVDLEKQRRMQKIKLAIMISSAILILAITAGIAFLVSYYDKIKLVKPHNSTNSSSPDYYFNNHTDYEERYFRTSELDGRFLNFKRISES